jgi:crotonobetaine/carnitine-CoA ligase
VVAEEFLHRTVPEVVDRAVAEVPEKTALVIAGDAVTYEQLRMRSLRVARGLADLGVSTGQNVCVLMENSLEHVYMWFASNYLGAVHVPINIANKGAFLAHQVGLTNAVVIAVDAVYLPNVRDVLAELPMLKDVIVHGSEAVDITADDGVRIHRMTDLQALEPMAPVYPTWRDPGAIVFTSGTTGPSKGVVLSHNYLVRSAVTREIGADDVCWSPLPLFHLNAMLITVLSSIARRSTGVLAKRFSVSRFWEQVREVDATFVSILGSMVVMLWNRPAEPNDADNRVHRMLASPIPVEIHEAFEKRFGLTFDYGYGLTECNPMLLRPPGAPPGVSGLPNPVYEVELHDDDGVPVGTGGLGEFVVRPREPHMMLEGYFGNPEATLEAFRGLWFHTGDLGTCDQQGMYRFAGRKKHYLRRRGENVSTYEVELALERHAAVAEAAVFGVHSDVAEEEIMACVRLQDAPAPLDHLALLEFCAADLPYFALPRYIELVEDFPRNAVGRILKHELQNRGVTDTTWDLNNTGRTVASYRWPITRAAGGLR